MKLELNRLNNFIKASCSFLLFCYLGLIFNNSEQNLVLFSNNGVVMAGAVPEYDRFCHVCITEENFYCKIRIESKVRTLRIFATVKSVLALIEKL